MLKKEIQRIRDQNN